MLLNQQTKVLLALRFSANGNVLQVIGDTVFHWQFPCHAGGSHSKTKVSRNSLR